MGQQGSFPRKPGSGEDKQGDGKVIFNKKNKMMI